MHTHARTHTQIDQQKSQFSMSSSRNTRTYSFLACLACLFLLLCLTFHTKVKVLRIGASKEISGKKLVQVGEIDSSCSVTGVICFISDFESALAQHIVPKIEISRINALIETFLDSSSKHCITLLTSKNGSNALRVSGVDIRARIIEIPLPISLKNQHFFISRWHVMSEFLLNIAETHIIFLDSDILALYRETEYIFTEGEWDIALTLTEYAEEQRRVNCGVMLVHKEGFELMILLSSYIISEGLKVLANPGSMEPNLAGEVLFNDQLLVLDFLNKYGNFKAPRLSRISNKVSVIENPCMIIDLHRNHQNLKKKFKILLLNRHEWNGNPVRLHSFTKFSHYKGNRKKYMMEHYEELKKLGKNFRSTRAHKWCSSMNPVQKCGSDQNVIFKNLC